MAIQHLEDLLRDELAETEHLGAWEYALQSIFLKIEPSELSRFRLKGLKAILPSAMDNLAQWTAKAAEIGALSRIDKDGELPKLQAGLAKLQGALAGAPDLRDLHQSILEELDEEVFQFLSRQDRFYRLVTAHIELMDPEARQKLRSAFQSLEKGLSQMGMERSEHLRNARAEANVVVNMPYGEQCVIAMLICAIAGWKVNRSSSETRRLLRMAWPRAKREADLLTGILGRALAHLEWQDSDPESAWPVLAQAAELDGDEDTMLEAVQLAIRTANWGQAKVLAQRGVDQSCLFAIRMLARPEMGEIAADMMEALIERQRTMRQQIGTELTAWNVDMNRIRQAAKTGGLEMRILDDFDELRKSIARQIASSDLIQANSLIFQAKSARHEMVRLATQLLNHEHAEASKALELAKTGMDRAWSEREAMIEKAVERQRGDVQIARVALQRALRDADKNQSGCVVGFGSGCAAFMLYLLIASFLTAQGVEAGFGTIFGWFGIAASGIPITLSIMSMMAHGAQKVMLDRALREKIALAQSAYDEAAKRADGYYRDSVVKLREALGDIEETVGRLEKALTVLNAA